MPTGSREITELCYERVMTSAGNCKACDPSKGLAANQLQQIVTMWESGPIIARPFFFFLREVSNLDSHVESSSDL